MELWGVDVNRRGDLVLDHHRHEDRADRSGDAEPRGEVRAIPDHYLFIAQDAIELRNQPGSSVESLDHLIVPACSGETDALPAAECLAAQDQHGRAGTEVQALLQEGIEDVDLRLAM